MGILRSDDQAFFVDNAISVLRCPAVREMADYPQHGATSCLSHCIGVAYVAFAISRRLRIRCHAHSLIKAALLHDFFLYDWHDRLGGHRLHGFVHPSVSLKNALRYFELSDRERDIIEKHMWPMTPRLPRYRETLLTCLADKICAVMEFFCGLFGIDPFRRLVARLLNFGM